MTYLTEQSINRSAYMDNLQSALNQSSNNSILLSNALERGDNKKYGLYAYIEVPEKNTKKIIRQRIEILRHCSSKDIDELFLKITDKNCICGIYFEQFEISSAVLTMLERCTKINRLRIYYCTSPFNIKKILLKSNIKHFSLTATYISPADLGFILDKDLCSLELRDISFVSSTDSLKTRPNTYGPIKEHLLSSHEITLLTKKFSTANLTSIDLNHCDNKFAEILFSSENISLQNLYYTPYPRYKSTIPESLYALFEKFISTHPKIVDLRTSENIASKIVNGLIISPSIERIHLAIESKYSNATEIHQDYLIPLTELIKHTKKINDFTLTHRLSSSALTEGPPFPDLQSCIKIFQALLENKTIEQFQCTVHSFDEIIEFIKIIPHTSKTLRKATIEYEFCPIGDNDFDSEKFNTKYNNYQQIIDTLLTEKFIQYNHES